MPFQLAGARFGATLAAAGDELWVGAPASDRNTGRVYRVTGWRRTARSAQHERVSTCRGSGAGREPGGHDGRDRGDAAVIGMPSDGGGGLGTVLFLGRTPAGAWTSRGMLLSGDG